ALELSLHGPLPGLRRPAGEAAAVIGEVESHRGHGSATLSPNPAVTRLTDHAGPGRVGFSRTHEEDMDRWPTRISHSAPSTSGPTSWPGARAFAAAPRRVRPSTASWL